MKIAESGLKVLMIKLGQLMTWWANSPESITSLLLLVFLSDSTRRTRVAIEFKFDRKGAQVMSTKVA